MSAQMRFAALRAVIDGADLTLVVGGEDCDGPTLAELAREALPALRSILNPSSVAGDSPSARTPRSGRNPA